MELKGRRLQRTKRLRSIIILQLEKARKRITVAVSGGALSEYEHKWQKHCRVAFKCKNLCGEKTTLSALCNWLTSLMLVLMLCVSSFL